MNNIIYLKLFTLFVLIILPFFKEKRMKIYHPVFLVSGIYFLEYLIPALYMTINPAVFWFYNMRINKELLDSGLTFILLTFLFFLIGFYLPKYDKNIKFLMSKLLNLLPNINGYSLSINNLPMVLLILSIIGWSSRLLVLKLGLYLHVEAGQVASEIVGFAKYAQYVHLSSLFPILVLILVFFEWLKTGKRSFQILSIILILLEIAYSLPSGSKEKIFMPLFLVLVMYSLKHKLPLIPLVILSMVFVFFLFPFSTIYRMNYNLTGSADIQYALQQYFKLFGTFDKTILNNLLFSIFGERLNYTYIVSVIVNNTPQIWDFTYGYTYILFFISIIPRIFWPEKPDINFLANDFGRDYGLLYQRDYTTSVDMSWIGEMFINFGWYGVLVALGYGLLYQVIFSYFTKGGKISSLSAIFFSFSIFYMIRGGMFAIQFGGLLKLYFVAIIILSPFLKKIKSLEVKK